MMHPEASAVNKPKRHVSKNARVEKFRMDDERPGDRFKMLRPGLVVAAVVFLVLWKAAPTIAAKLPVTVNAVTGKFTIIGLALVSLLTGGTYLGVEEILKRYYDD